MTNCKNCQRYGRSCVPGDWEKVLEDCEKDGNYIPWTNADRIRNSTDEELAIFLGFVVQDAFLYGARIRPQMTIYPFNDLEGTAKWLKQEANMEETL